MDGWMDFVGFVEGEGGAVGEREPEREHEQEQERERGIHRHGVGARSQRVLGDGAVHGMVWFGLMLMKRELEVVRSGNFDWRMSWH